MEALHSRLVQRVGGESIELREGLGKLAERVHGGGVPLAEGGGPGLLAQTGSQGVVQVDSGSEHAPLGQVRLQVAADTRIHPGYSIPDGTEELSPEHVIEVGDVAHALRPALVDCAHLVLLVDHGGEHDPLGQGAHRALPQVEGTVGREAPGLLTELHGEIDLPAGARPLCRDEEALILPHALWHLAAVGLRGDALGLRDTEGHGQGAVSSQRGIVHGRAARQVFEQLGIASDDLRVDGPIALRGSLSELVGGR